MEYFRKLEAVKDRLCAELVSRGVEERYLGFGDPADISKPPRVPTDVRSEFLANRAMGDWAENILAASIRKVLPNKKVVHYGESDSISAGDSGFKEFFIERWKEVGLYGKRPDLLVMDKSVECETDISYLPTSQLTQTVELCDFSIEVRSSKFEALTYIDVRNREWQETGRKPSQLCPSFTVKVEDLLIVYRWLSQNRCPQLYCQVFFDSIFAINFLDIFEIIASGEGYKIETPAKSQLKSTIMIRHC
jgi:hypothetical protein